MFIGKLQSNSLYARLSQSAIIVSMPKQNKKNEKKITQINIKIYKVKHM